MWRFFLLCIFLCSTSPLWAEGDSIVSGRSLFVIPHASYQQETGLAPGVAYGYYFPSRDLSRISSISGSAVYTLRHQFMLNATPKLYFGHNKWYLYSNLNIRRYPDEYYGIDANATGVEEHYVAHGIPPPAAAV